MAPLRICSLLPSATEIVCALGLRDQLVAVTHECDFPPEVAALPHITSSSIDHEDHSSREIHRHISRAVHGGSSIYQLDQELLEQLAPDLILTQELCDVCAVSYETVSRAVRLLEAPCRVLSLEPASLEQILDSILAVGNQTDTWGRAANLVAELGRRIEKIKNSTGESAGSPRVLALEWLDPPFVGGHWVPEMISAAGGVDVLGIAGRPSFETDWARIEAARPDVVILMPCGFDLRRTLDEFSRTVFPDSWKRLPAVRSRQVFAVDGSGYFNRPGPRVVDGVEILAEILAPRQHPRLKPASCWQRVTV